MKKRTKSLLAIIGVILAVTGGFTSIPLMLRENYLAGSLFIACMIVGLIMVALAFGE